MCAAALIVLTGCPESLSSVEPGLGSESESSSESSGPEETGTEETGTETGQDTEPLSCEGYDEADYEDQPAIFELEADRAIMSGYIDSSTPSKLEQLLDDHPDLEVIVMPFVPGSADDEANLEAALMLYASGVDTCVPSQGLIASGGVDFFLAGDERAAAEGAQIGVHSWATGDGIEGGELPMDHPDHALYLDYYAQIGIPAAFYWFTLEAAASSDIHWMSGEEMMTYEVLTQ